MISNNQSNPKIKRLWTLFAIMPALLLFGPFFETQFHIPFLSIAGSFALLTYLSINTSLISDIERKIRMIENEKSDKKKYDD